MPGWRIPSVGILVLAGSALACAQGGSADAFVARIPAGAFPSTVVFTATTAGGIPGHTVTIPILVAAGSAAPISFQFDLTFDPDTLTFVSAGGPGGLATQIVSTGDVRFSLPASNPNPIPNGAVAWVTFTVGAQFQTSSPLTLINCAAAGAGGALSTGCTPGSIVTFTCAVTGDQIASVSDVQSLINQALGLVPAVNDLNHDGIVGIADVQKVLDAALGMGCVEEGY